MSTLSLQLIPGYQFPTDGSVDLSFDLLNLLGKPTVNLIGSIGAASISDNSITTAKLVDGVLSADATGRAKMADGFLSADATGRAKIASAFFAAGDATSLAYFGAGFLTPDKLASTAAAVIGSARNLIAAQASASTATITADEVLVKDSSSRPYLLSTVSLTLNMATSGANGLDTGSEASNTWYYLWVIWNGTTASGLISTSSTAPTLPGGYTHKALVSVVRNDGSSNFVAFWQHDRVVLIAEQAVFSSQAGSAGYTSQSISSYVPPIAKRARGQIGTSTSSSDGFAIAGDSNGLGKVVSVGKDAAGAFESYFHTLPFEVPLITAQTVYCKMVSTSAAYRLTVTGYVI